MKAITFEEAEKDCVQFEKDLRKTLLETADLLREVIRIEEANGDKVWTPDQTAIHTKYEDALFDLHASISLFKSSEQHWLDMMSPENN